jgi:NTP pyrophosphatase (non-canonical NTP hydrolase)
MTRRDIVYHTIQWAKERDILEQGTVSGQITKLFEEVEELKAAYLNDNKEEMVDAIGDIQVVLEIVSEMLGINPEEAFESAYNVIKTRKGKMVGGVFVKDGDLTPDADKDTKDYGDPLDWKWINEGDRP